MAYASGQQLARIEMDVHASGDLVLLADDRTCTVSMSATV